MRDRNNAVLIGFMIGAFCAGIVGIARASGIWLDSTSLTIGVVCVLVIWFTTLAVIAYNHK